MALAARRCRRTGLPLAPGRRRLAPDDYGSVLLPDLRAVPEGHRRRRPRRSASLVRRARPPAPCSSVGLRPTLTPARHGAVGLAQPRPEAAVSGEVEKARMEAVPTATIAVPLQHHVRMLSYSTSRGTPPRAGKACSWQASSVS